LVSALVQFSMSADISSINSIAALCEATGADVQEVARAGG
jgi:UDP-glucose 6-dehydrogenase